MLPELAKSIRYAEIVIEDFLARKIPEVVVAKPNSATIGNLNLISNGIAPAIIQQIENIKIKTKYVVSGEIVR